MTEREPLFSREAKREGLQLYVVAIVVVLAVLSLGVVAVYGRYVAGYLTQPARLTGAERVEAMSAKMNEAHQGLIAADRAVVAAQEKVTQYERLYGADASTWPQGKRAEYQQDQQHLTNATAAYNRACATYNATYADEYQAIAAPDDLPKNCAFR
jgi:hypothetical protein